MSAPQNSPKGFSDQVDGLLLASALGALLQKRQKVPLLYDPARSALASLLTPKAVEAQLALDYVKLQ
jgi:hypothetical protein